jgi:hypothetical protein
MKNNTDSEGNFASKAKFPSKGINTAWLKRMSLLLAVEQPAAVLPEIWPCAEYLIALSKKATSRPEQPAPVMVFSIAEADMLLPIL